MTDETTTKPWAGDHDALMAHYGDSTISLGRCPEYVEEQAALDWARNGDPKDGERLHPSSEYYMQDGQLLAADGAAEPDVVWSGWGAQSQSDTDGWAR